MKDIIGIDVGGTSIKWGRADSNGKMIAFGKVPTERENPRGVLTKIANIVAVQGCHEDWVELFPAWLLRMAT